MQRQGNTKKNTLLQAAHGNVEPRLAREYFFLLPKKYLNIFSNPSKKKNKTPDTQTNMTKTVKLNSDNGLQTRWTRTPAGNSVLPQLAVKCKIEAKCSCQTFIQVDREVLRNRQLRQHASR